MIKICCSSCHYSSLRLLWSFDEPHSGSLWLVIDLTGRHQTMEAMNGSILTQIGSSDSPLWHSEWMRLRWPLCFQCRRFDIYCSWLLFKRTSHSSKMPGEGGRALERSRFFPGSVRHNHGFQVLQQQQRPTGSWLAGQSEMKNSVSKMTNMQEETERERESGRKPCVWPSEVLMGLSCCTKDSVIMFSEQLVWLLTFAF